MLSQLLHTPAQVRPGIKLNGRKIVQQSSSPIITPSPLTIPELHTHQLMAKFFGDNEKTRLCGIIFWVWILRWLHHFKWLCGPSYDQAATFNNTDKKEVNIFSSSSNKYWNEATRLEKYLSFHTKLTRVTFDTQISKVAGQFVCMCKSEKIKSS